MTDAEIDRIAEALRMAGPLPYYQCQNLLAEVRRLRKICADARPFADMALQLQPGLRPGHDGGNQGPPLRPLLTPASATFDLSTEGMTSVAYSDNGLSAGQ
jgi:hypothetical protein